MATHLAKTVINSSEKNFKYPFTLSDSSLPQVTDLLFLQKPG